MGGYRCIYQNNKNSEAGIIYMANKYHFILKKKQKGKNKHNGFKVQYHAIRHGYEISEKKNKQRMLVDVIRHFRGDTKDDLFKQD